MDLPRNTIIVAEDEELVSLLERIHISKFTELFVVIPGGAVIGRSALNLKILKKEADQHQKTIRVVAQDPGLHRLAQGLGIAWEGDVDRFWKRIEEHLGDSRLRYASEYVNMTDIVPAGEEPQKEEAPSDEIIEGGDDEQDFGERITITTPSTKTKSDEKPKEKPEEQPEPKKTPAPKPTPTAKATSKSAQEDRPKQRKKEPVRGRKQELQQSEGEATETIVRLYNRMDESFKEKDDKEASRFDRIKQSGKKRDAKRSSGSRKSWFILGGFGVAAVLLFVVVASVVLPRADVVVTPRSERASVELAVISDANRSGVDAEQAAIPGQILEVSRSAQRTFPATGEKEVQERATGIITVYNQFSSAAQTLVKTTRFLSDSGKLFRTTETVVIPGATVESGEIIPSSIQVEIQADEPGPDFNIGPSRFSIPGFEGTPKFDGFYGESNESFEGGALGVVRVATEEDIKGATAILEQEATQAAEDELSNRIPEEFTLLEGARETIVTDTASTVDPEAAAEEFAVTLEVRARAFVFRESDVAEVINQRLSDTIAEGTKELRPDTLSLSLDPEVVNFEEGTLTMTAQAEESIAWIVSADILRNELQGQNEDGVQDVLANHPEVSAVEVTFWPFWVDRVPDNPDRINIMIE